jgi:hypothetical protein
MNKYLNNIRKGLVGVMAKPNALFFIKRSNNDNVVVYEVKNTDEEWRNITVEWIMLEHAQPYTEALNLIESTMAYGATVVSREDNFTINVRALSNRLVTILKTQTGFMARTIISGEMCCLVAVYVKLKDSLLIPSIDYIILYGIDLATKKNIVETVRQ